ncbi:hypothetical protein G418_17590 [Rhodococcus qingshengii BKS 20-40]|nr:hypothetical protein G418_17590 [Rhodococcus qingshengii BKS 20-40]
MSYSPAPWTQLRMDAQAHDLRLQDSLLPVVGMPCSRGRSNIVVSRYRDTALGVRRVLGSASSRRSRTPRAEDAQNERYMFTWSARGERSQLVRSAGEFAGTVRRESAQVVGVGGVERHWREGV